VSAGQENGLGGGGCARGARGAKGKGIGPEEKFPPWRVAGLGKLSWPGKPESH
jgi:hypothetical protein